MARQVAWNNNNVPQNQIRDLDIKVVKQAKNRKENQIQSANKIMNTFLKDTQACLKDKNLKPSALLSTIQRINRTYSTLFQAVNKRKENLTQRLFIYEYRRLRNDTATDLMAEHQFKRVESCDPVFKIFACPRIQLQSDAFQFVYGFQEFTRSQFTADVP